MGLEEQLRRKAVKRCTATPCVLLQEMVEPTLGKGRDVNGASSAGSQGEGPVGQGHSTSSHMDRTWQRYLLCYCIPNAHRQKREEIAFRVLVFPLEDCLKKKNHNLGRCQGMMDTKPGKKGQHFLKNAKHCQE